MMDTPATQFPAPPNFNPLDKDKNSGKGGKAEKKQGGLFSHKQVAASVDITEITEQINRIARRIRVIEERYLNLRKKAEVIEQNLLLFQRKAQDNNKSLQNDLRDYRNQLADLTSKFSLMIKELKGAATKEDMVVLKKYVELWDPMNFVRKNDVEDIVEAVLEEKLSKKKTL